MLSGGRSGWVMFRRLDEMDVDFLNKSKGKETVGPRFPVPGKKKAAELAKHALGRESQFALNLKELATISPMMAEELISVIRESVGWSRRRRCHPVFTWTQ
ncbi:hypothetical protein VP01_549g2 [Puccinia sorghi]|uniref:Uncharacterized protein n=1 Tax=Puccinia sorghi TaxID=27349 RepID=A0A0L6UJF6_9BASI|nr:hypothetical protein VP01_549g2 [Puccinia sorghi]